MSSRECSVTALTLKSTRTYSSPINYRKIMFVYSLIKLTISKNESLRFLCVEYYNYRHQIVRIKTLYHPNVSFIVYTCTEKRVK